MNPFNRSCLAALLWSFGLMLPLAALAEEPLDAARAVQGKWVRHQKAPDGSRIKIIKEHKQPKTILTAYDEKGNILYSHESEYKVEQSGKVRIFTFSNRTITAGPDAGQKTKEPVSFIFRVTGNRFIEVRGVLDDDPLAPGMVIWDRVAEEA